MRLRKWETLTSIPLIILSLLFIVINSIAIFTNSDKQEQTIYIIIEILISLVFLIDFIIRLAISENRWVWFKKNAWELSIIFVPMLRPLVLLKYLVRLRKNRSNRKENLRFGLALYSICATLIVSYAAVLNIYAVERDAPGANITNFGDAFWWLLVTVTTVGYGDYYPVTLLGRLIAAGIMLLGITLLSIFTAILSSWIIETVKHNQNNNQEDVNT